MRPPGTGALQKRHVFPGIAVSDGPARMMRSGEVWIRERQGPRPLSSAGRTAHRESRRMRNPSSALVVACIALAVCLVAGALHSEPDSVWASAVARAGDGLTDGTPIPLPPRGPTAKSLDGGSPSPVPSPRPTAASFTCLERIPHEIPTSPAAPATIAPRCDVLVQLPTRAQVYRGHSQGAEAVVTQTNAVCRLRPAAAGEYLGRHWSAWVVQRTNAGMDDDCRSQPKVHHWEYSDKQGTNQTWALTHVRLNQAPGWTGEALLCAATRAVFECIAPP